MTATELAPRLARLTRDVAFLPKDATFEENERLRDLFEEVGLNAHIRVNLRFLLDQVGSLDARDQADLNAMHKIVIACHYQYPREFERFVGYLGCQIFRDASCPGWLYLTTRESLDEGEWARSLSWHVPGVVSGDLAHLPSLPYHVPED